MSSVKQKHCKQIDTIFTETREVTKSVIASSKLDLWSISRDLEYRVAKSTLSSYQNAPKNHQNQRNISFALVVAMELEYGCNDALKYHAEKLGYVAIPIPDVSNSSDIDTKQAAITIRESSEAIIEISNAIADGIIEKKELLKLNKEIMEAITSLMAFKKNCIDIKAFSDDK